ncbi:serine hydrolase [Thalassococcus sp. S3]|uniref:serine hydrolase n=1 Tax=Thalassococcus sp. S3 TaxID=2017482 RepID=UPI0013EEB0D3|nr:serine hydrolase [Thalassococcus sp. S3]
MTRFDPDTLSAPQRAALDDFAQSTKAPAVLVEVWRDGLSVSSAQGVVAEGSDMKASTENKIQAGSQTKMMTATLVLQLAAEGQVDLDAKLSDYVESSVLSGIANAEDATLRELLSHRSGIVDFDDVLGQSGIPTYLEQLLSDPTTPVGSDDLLEFVTGTPAHFAPGTDFRYSNTNYLLLEKLVEAVTGESFGAALESRVFNPSGMNDSSLDVPGHDDNRLSGYFDAFDRTLDVTDVPLTLGGAGGVVSTTSDLIRFMDALLVSRTLLASDQLEEMLTFLASDGTPSDAGAGLGLFSTTVYGQLFVGHAGGTLGHATLTLVHMESGTIVTAAATHYTADPDGFVLDVFARIFNDTAWADFDADTNQFDIAGTASEIDLSKTASGDTEVSLGDASLTLDGGLGDLDTSRFSFSDGSILWIGEDGRDRFDVLRDAREVRHADNQLVGRNGNDDLSGGHGNDKLVGGAGRDTMRGRDGNDTLEGGTGRDLIDAGTGDDLLRGGSGADLLIGRGGDDVIHGGKGDDLLIGGQGADRFVFQAGSGNDTILDFEAGSDVIDFSKTGLSFDDLRITKPASGLVQIEYGDDTLTLTWQNDAPSEDDFIF